MSREEREKRRERVQERKAEWEKRGKNVIEEKLTVKVVWKNVRKIRTMEKQMELEEWMKKSDCDVCAINETGLNGNEYVEVGDEHKWIGTNRDWMKGKTGGVGFIIKRSLVCEWVICESEDVCFLKVPI